MLCEKCKKNEANAYIKTNVNGDVHEYHLCSQCAAEMKNSDEFSSLFHFDLTSGKRCSVCGSDFRSIADSGKVGCPNCYTEFRGRLAPTIKKLHGNSVHCGKHSKVTTQESKENETVSLKKQLADAVKAENYELAAELRDKIRAMEA